jgi:hypothetical protein
MNRSCSEAEELREIIVEQVEQARTESYAQASAQHNRLEMAENTTKRMEAQIEKFTNASNESADRVIEASVESRTTLCNNIHEVAASVSGVVQSADLHAKVKKLTEQVNLVKKLMKQGETLKALEARVTRLRQEVAQRQAGATADGFLKEMSSIEKRGNVTMDYATARLHLKPLEWIEVPPVSAEAAELTLDSVQDSRSTTVRPADTIYAKRLAEDVGKAVLLFGSTQISLEVVIPNDPTKASDRARALLQLFNEEGIRGIAPGQGLGKGLQCYLQFDVYDPEDIMEPTSPKAGDGGGGKGGKGAAKGAAAKAGAAGRSKSP